MLLKLSLRTTEVPVIFRNRIAELIKSAAEVGYNSLGMEINEKSYKFFTFNLAFPRDDVRQELIKFDQEFEVFDSVFHIAEGKDVTLYVSSPSLAFLEAVKEGFTMQKVFDFSRGGQILVGGREVNYYLEDAHILNKPITIEQSGITLHTHSPILLESMKSKKPIIPQCAGSSCGLEVTEQEYAERLAEVSSMRIFGLTGKYPVEPVVFTPVNVRKTVIKHTLDKFREKTGKSLMMLTGITGTFRLTGHPDDIPLLIESGLGIRTTQGFGMSGPYRI